jgi:hypothetical protein
LIPFWRANPTLVLECYDWNHLKLSLESKT